MRSTPLTKYQRLRVTFCALFQDSHRQSAASGNSDPDLQLTHDTSIADWREGDDLLDWRRFAAAMNKEWNIDSPLDDWRNALEPAKARTVGELCEFLAQRTTAPRIGPLNSAGLACKSAGVFLSIRSLLADAGADPNSIRPSARLDDYTRRYRSVFFGPISRLAPGALPPVTIKKPVSDMGNVLVAATFLVAVISFVWVRHDRLFAIVA